MEALAKAWSVPLSFWYRDRKYKRNEGCRGVCVSWGENVRRCARNPANYGRMLVTKFAPHFDLWENARLTSLPQPVYVVTILAKVRLHLRLSGGFLMRTPSIHPTSSQVSHALPAINTLNDEWKWFRVKRSIRLVIIMSSV